MESTIINSFAGLITAIAPIVAAILQYKQKIIDGHDLSKEVVDSGEVKPISKANFHSFALNCGIVYFVAGATTAGIGVFNYIAGFNNKELNESFWLWEDICWLVGNLTILLMLIMRSRK